MARSTVTVDREYYAAQVRAIRLSSAALQPGPGMDLSDLSPEQEAAGKALRLASPPDGDSTWMGIVPETLGGCEPPLQLAEIEFDSP